MAICNQPGDSVGEIVDGTTTARVFNWRNGFELVHLTFNDGAFAQKQLINQRNEAILHIAV